MILGIVSLISLIGLIFISYRKLENIAIYGGQKRTLFISILEFALAIILVLFLMFSQFTTGYAASQDEYLLPDALEASQYLYFASFFIPIILILLALEILVNIKFIGTRGRLKSTFKMEK